MREGTHKSNIENIMPLTVKKSQLAVLLDVSEDTAVKIAEMAQARVDFGSLRLVRYNVNKILNYIDKQSW